MRACPSGSSAVVLMRTPMRRTRSVVGCARAASGHAAAPPRSVTSTSRRFIVPVAPVLPELRITRLGMLRCGISAALCPLCGQSQNEHIMSALPPRKRTSDLRVLMSTRPNLRKAGGLRNFLRPCLPAGRGGAAVELRLLLCAKRSKIYYAAAHSPFPANPLQNQVKLAGISTLKRW